MFAVSASRAAALGAALILTMATALSAAKPAAQKPAAPPARRNVDNDPFAGGPETPPRTDKSLYRFLPQPSDGERRIEAVLETASPPIEFSETSLKDVVEYLKDATHIEIQLDAAGLKDAGVDPESPVTKNLRGIRLESALDMLLSDLGLGWEVRYDVLLITTPKRLAGHWTTKLYEVGDLVAVGGKSGKAEEDYRTLIGLITATVAPDSWRGSAAPATIKGATLGAAKVLSVSAPYAVHRELAEYLANVRRIAKGD